MAGQPKRTGTKAAQRERDDHPFYCFKKQCRKTAWETPEHLTEGDLALLERLDGVQTEAEFHQLAFERRETAEGFFHRVIGWPEGLRYMQGDLSYREQTGWPMVRRSIERALASLERRGGATDDAMALAAQM